MTNATADTTKRKRPDQAGTPIMVRLQPGQLAKLDQWIADHEEAISRPEAVRRILSSGLAHDS